MNTRKASAGDIRVSSWLFNLRIFNNLSDSCKNRYNLCKQYVRERLFKYNAEFKIMINLYH